MILTMLDTTGTQAYIFGSNRLQENIGASELVYRATTTWAFQVLAEMQLRHNITITQPLQGQWKFNGGQIEKNELDAEVVFAGGGNMLLVFQGKEAAHRFVSQLTRRLLQDAPGLNVVAQHIDFDWQQDRIDIKRQELIERLAEHKQRRLPSSPLLGLGVTQPCAATGLVATRTDAGKTTINVVSESVDIDLRVGDQKEEEPRPISRETECKLGWRDCANERLKAAVASRYQYPFDVDKLGRVEGEESYVAVIHADGNQIGEHSKAVGRNIDWTAENPNRAYVEAMRTFSVGVNNASMAALRQVIALLELNIAWNEERKQELVAEKVPLNENYLPFRPLVFGGDDVTFLANGQLGLALAAAYLEAFAEEVSNNKMLPKIFASAGIAAIKMHYPFARAYQLSEELAESAKRSILENRDYSALDWHFATTGLSGSLSTIRQREYSRPDSQQPDLTLRPLRLHHDPTQRDGRYWRNGLESIITTFQEDETWTERRNKVKDLRIPLREGPEAVERFRLNFNLPLLPNGLVANDTSYQEVGWMGEQCVYLDAIELLDHYVSLSTTEVAT